MGAQLVVNDGKLCCLQFNAKPKSECLVIGVEVEAQAGQLRYGNEDFFGNLKSAISSPPLHFPSFYYGTIWRWDLQNVPRRETSMAVQAIRMHGSKLAWSNFFSEVFRCQ